MGLGSSNLQQIFMIEFSILCHIMVNLLTSSFISEGTKNKVLEGEAKGCQCGLEKQVLENKCKELELEKKR